MAQTNFQQTLFELRGAEVLPGTYKNFSGRPDKYHPAGGKTSFHIIVPDSAVGDLVEAGFNLKPLNKQEETDPDSYRLEIKFTMDGKRPPEMYQMNDNGYKVPVVGPGVSKLDQLYLRAADLVFHAYYYEDGKASAWLDTALFYPEINRSELQQSIANIPDAPTSDNYFAPYEVDAE